MLVVRWVADWYEGIDSDYPYSYCPHTESLEDGEGSDINRSIVGVEHNCSDDDDHDDNDDDNNDYDESLVNSLTIVWNTILIFVE